MAITKSHGRPSVADERKKVSKAAVKSSKTAFRISRALDIPVQIIEKGRLVEITTDGTKHTLKAIKKSSTGSKGLKKGDTIWLKQKG